MALKNYKLSPEQEAQRLKIQSLEKEFQHLKSTCKHLIVQHIADDGTPNEWGWCPICDTFFGKFCTSGIAPDNLCRIGVNERNKISLLDNSEVDPPPDYKQMMEQHKCFYCKKNADEEDSEVVLKVVN